METVRTWWPWYGLIAVAVATAGIWWAMIALAPDDQLRVAFLDVGQGDAIYIETPRGRQVLVDAGPNRSVARELSRQMPLFDRTLDVILATHPDKDHIGGFPAVLQHYHVSAAAFTSLAADTDTYAAFRDALAAESLRRIRPRRGSAIALGPETTLTFLFPDRRLSGVDRNLGSVVAKLTHGDTSFLLTGDSPDAVERYLARLDKETLEVDVLKVGHHGSETSTTEQLLGYADPEYAVISAGKDNRYGHPDEQVLRQLEQFDVEVFGTYEDGTVVFESDGREVIVVNGE